MFNDMEIKKDNTLNIINTLCNADSMISQYLLFFFIWGLNKYCYMQLSSIFFLNNLTILLDTKCLKSLELRERVRAVSYR